jgi:beta-lactamase class A
MLDFDAVGKGRNNYTSNRDMRTLYLDLRLGKILDKKRREFAWRCLLAQRSKNLLLRYVHEDVKFAHKTGGLDNLSHDAGVFESGGKPAFYLGVLAQGTKEASGAPSLIGQVGRHVLDAAAVR